MLTTTVQQMLEAKDATLYGVTPDTSVYKALELMAEKNIGALLVTDAGGSLVGIFSERDYARKVVLHGKSSRDLPVKDIMTTRVLGVRPEQTTEECMALMTEKHIRHLPVKSGDKLVGVISIGDVVRAMIDEQRFVIQQLENYITGGR